MKSEVTKDFICEFSDSIVPYLYGESSEAERDRFETHIADCTPCTDEFAGLSFSRYSVFEWQKEEFAPMPTPQIVIPYAAKPIEAAGFFAGLRELLAFNWATAVGAAAVLAVVVGIGFVAVNYFGKTEQQIATINESNKNVAVAIPASSPIVPVVEPKIVTVAKTPDVTPVRGPQPVKIAAINQTERRPKQTTTANNVLPKGVNNEDVRSTPKQVRKSPSLTAEADDDDRSLRLTDLFDTVDTRL